MSSDVLYWINDDDSPEYYKLHRFGDEVHRADLRDVASEWHGGQWSALYAFASSGAIVRGLACECDTAAQFASINEAADDHQPNEQRAFDDSLLLLTLADIARTHGDD
jgi:hypothetical protein